MKSLSAKTFQCGVTVQGLTTLSGTVYLTALTNTATWDYVIVGTSAQGQLYTRTYAQLMSDVSSGITLSLDGLSDVVAPTPSTGQLLRYNGIQWANWTPTFYSLPAGGTTLQYIDGTGAFQTFPTSLPASSVKHQVKAGVAINKGQAVYVTSADGTNMIVGLASNTSEATSSKTMGLLDATVSTNGFANVVTEGLLAGLDTTAAGAEGDPVWLGTGGNLIYGLANKPYAPAHLVFIGIVTRKNLNNGEIFIKVQNGFELREIHDVDLITTVPVNGHILGFDGTLWVNKTIAGWLGYTPANASGTTNYISKFTGSTTLGNSLIYDDGSGVGIGTTSPSSKLSIVGPDNASGLGVLELVTSSTNLKLGGNFDYSWIQSHNSKPLRINELGNNVILNLGGGNTGIGTSSPSYKLDVSGDINFTNTLKFGGTTVLSGSASDVYGNIRVLYSASSNNDGMYINYNSSGGTGADLRLFANGTNERVRIKADSGNVGIGTTSPDSKLHIEGTTTGSGSGADAIVHIKQNGSWNGNEPWALYVEGYSYLNGFRVNAADGQRGLYTDAAQLGFAVGGNSPISFTQNTSDYRMYIAPGGNIGIGTTSPVSKLHVLLNGNTSGGPTGNVASFQNSSVGNNAYITLFGSYNAESGIVFTDESEQYKGKIGYNNNTEHMYFQTDGSERMRITSAGNVGIATTDTSLARLRIIGEGGTGNAAIMSDYGNTAVLGEVSTIAHRGGQWHTLYVSESGGSATNAVYVTGTKPVILNAGNVGIGTGSPIRKLHVNGDVQVDTNLVVSSGIYNTNYYAGSATATYFKNSVGTDTLTILQSGNVGIGTTNPTGQLTVAKQYSSYTPGEYLLKLRGGNGGIYDLVDAYYDSDAAIFRVGYAGLNNSRAVINGGTSAGGASLSLVYGSTLKTYITADGASYFNGGNVGIGTASPAYKLQVAGGDIAIDYNRYLRGGGGGDWNLVNLYNGGTGDMEITMLNANWYLRHNANASFAGNVGVGTSSPATKFVVSNAGASGFEVAPTGGVGSGVLLQAYNRSTSAYMAQSYYALAHTFNVGSGAGTRVLDITSAGNVGIGTSNPSQKFVVSNGSSEVFKVYGGGEVVADTNYIYAAYSSGTSFYSQGPASFRNGIHNDTSTYLKIDGGTSGFTYFSGNVGIGTTSPLASLHVAGAIRNSFSSGVGGTNYLNIIDGVSNGFQTTITSGNDITYTFHNGANVGVLNLASTGAATFSNSVSSAELLVNNSVPKITFTPLTYGGSYRTVLGARGNAESVLQLGNNGNNYIVAGNTNSGGALSFYVNATSDFITSTNGTLALTLASSSAATFSSSVTATTYFVSDGGDFGWGNGTTYIDGDSSNQYIRAVINNSEKLRIVSSGNVGIGTTSPSHNLHIYGAGDRLIKIENTGTYLMYVGLLSNEGYIGSTNATALGFYTNNVNRIYINTSGNIGIGTTSPTNRLQIGSIGSSGYGGNDLAIGNGTQAMAFYQSSTVSTWYTNTSFSLMPSGSGSVGNLGVGTDTPTQRVHVSGNLRVTGAFYDSNNQAGTSGQILKSTGSGTDWVSLSEITGVDGSGTANYVTKWSDADTVTNSLIYDNGTNVGIGTTSPGYNFDVNGQVRVQDKLRVGTVNSGNGVVHMSSSATINPNTTTIVWAQNVSVGMCAFIEYYILNDTSLTDQRAGTIMVTWNQSGTPTIAHTETTTPDIGSTTSINFTSSLVGADARINAVNSSANPYTIVMSYKYF